jgi:hypothetical protein
MLPTYYLTEILSKVDFEGLGEQLLLTLTTILTEIGKTVSGGLTHLTDLN